MTASTTVKLSARRKALSVLLAAGALGLNLSPGAALAKSGARHGYGAAALVGGVILGALAASAASARPVDDEPECWTEMRVSRDA